MAYRLSEDRACFASFVELKLEQGQQQRGNSLGSCTGQLRLFRRSLPCNFAALVGFWVVTFPALLFPIESRPSTLSK